MEIHLAARGKRNFRIQLLDVHLPWLSAGPMRFKSELGTCIWWEERETEDFRISNEMAESQFYKSKMFISQHNCSFSRLLESFHCAR